MALLMNVEVDNMGISVDAYINIKTMTINKRNEVAKISGLASYYASEDIRLANGPSFRSEKFNFEFVVGGDCPYVQIYNYLKTLDKFSTATDLL